MPLSTKTSLKNKGSGERIRDSKEVKKHEPSQFTIEFSDFYQGILLKLYNVKDRKFLNDVKNALKNIRQLNYDIANWKEKTFFGTFSFKEPAARCAYMYSYSIINTSVVYCEFLKHLKSIESQTLEFFSGKSYRMCCLGGGPGLEVIGICRAIHDVVWKSIENGGNSSIENGGNSSIENGGNSSINIHVTMVDICPEWKSEASLILNTAIKSTTLFSPRHICFQVEYLQADLLEPLDGSVKKAIEESDIVTIVKLVNSIQSSSQVDDTSKLYNLVEIVSNNMTKNSCLFMLDTAGGGTFNHAIGKLPKSSKPRGVLKQTNEHKTYRLHPSVLQKLENALDFVRLCNLSTLLPTPLTRISSCIWLKLEAPPVEEGKKKKEKKKKTVPSEN